MRRRGAGPAAGAAARSAAGELPAPVDAELDPVDGRGRAVWRASVAVSLTLVALRLLSIPPLVTYDGRGYLQLAEHLGPGAMASWDPLRVPLFPVLLRAAVAVVGKSSLAVELVPFLAGVAGSFVAADLVRGLAGRVAAGFVLVVLSLHLTAVVYGHAVLTETGTFLLLALAAHRLPVAGGRERTGWSDAASLGAICGLAYLWRQTLGILTPGLLVGFLVLRWRLAPARSRARLAAQALLLVALPALSAGLWTSRFPPGQLDVLARRVTRTFALHQGLLPSSALPAGLATDYERERATASREGWPYRVPWREATRLSAALGDPRPGEGTVRWLLAIAVRDPSAYAAAAWRTTAALAGAPSPEQETRNFAAAMLTNDASWVSPKPDPPEPGLALRVSDGAVRRALRLLRGPSEILRIGTWLVVLPAFAWACKRRDPGRIVLAATPLLYLAPHVVLLLAFTRFAAPAELLFVAVLGVSGADLVAWLRRHASGGAGDQGRETSAGRSASPASAPKAPSARTA